MHPSRQVLIPFIKAPLLGQIKTRLQPQLSEWQALLFYSGMLGDLIHRIKSLKEWDTIYFYSPAHARKIMRVILPSDATIVIQSGDDLGQRMQQAFQHVFDLGYNKAVLIGSDLPLLSSLHIAEAFDKLSKSDLVLMPTEDGGYGLIGLNQVYVDLFQNISWSKENVFTETLSIARQLNLDVYKMETQFDVDTIDDVEKLCHIIESMDEKEKKSFEKTRRALEKIGLQ